MIIIVPVFLLWSFCGVGLFMSLFGNECTDSLPRVFSSKYKMWSFLLICGPITWCLTIDLIEIKIKSTVIKWLTK